MNSRDTNRNGSLGFILGIVLFLVPRSRVPSLYPSVFPVSLMLKDVKKLKLHWYRHAHNFKRKQMQLLHKEKN